MKKKQPEAVVSLSLKIPLSLWQRLKHKTSEQPGLRMGVVAQIAIERGLEELDIKDYLAGAKA